MTEISGIWLPIITPFVDGAVDLAGYERMQERLSRLEKDRDNVKLRVQRVLEQVDTLTQAAADAS